MSRLVVVRARPDRRAANLNELLSVRTTSTAVRDKVLRVIDRIVRAEALASGATKEPLVEPMASRPL
jgi:metal-dependent amidase/aminoacylase/carboxypeptidase family protein